MRNKEEILGEASLFQMNTTFSLQDPDLFRQRAFVAGRWCDADSGATLEVNNPATGEILGTVPKMGVNETWRAIEAAKDAFIDWSRKPAEERSVLMRRWHNLIMANLDDLGALMTAEQGKPLTEAKDEVAYAASFIEWFAEEAKRVYGDTIPSPWNDGRLVVIKQPIGVCAAVTPWNFPAAMIARKAAPALAAGRTMVAKPAESTPYSAFALAVLAERAGIPSGVLNVLTGEARGIGGEMTCNRCSQDYLHRLNGSRPPAHETELLYGKEAFPGVRRECALYRFRRCRSRCGRGRGDYPGQTCVCANRLYVQAGVYDAFAEKLVAAVGKLKVGNGFEPDVQQGPLIDNAAVEKIEEHIQDAVSKGGAMFFLEARGMLLVRLSLNRQCWRMLLRK